MKGVIADCLREMIVKKFGQPEWDSIKEKAKIEANLTVYSTVEDKVILNLIKVACQHLHLTLAQATEAFGEYWSCHYAPKKYKHYYSKYKNAKDFITNLDKIHVTMTNTIKDAEPPRFDYQWKNEHSLLITYKSKRNMLDFAVSLLRGIGKYYNNNISVFKFGVNKIQVNFN